MRLIQQIVVILLVLVVVAQVATSLYMSSQDRSDPPVITCPNDVLEVSGSDPKYVLLDGVKAIDPQDGDITDRIVIGSISRLVSEDVAKVTLLVFDRDNNMGSCVRKIRYKDYHRPRFSIISPLIGTAAEDISIASHVAAYDVIDGNISQRIRISTLTPTDNPEVMQVTLQVANSLGDISTLQLPVLTQGYDPTRPVVNLKEYLIYLEKGQDFDAASYIRSVQLRNGYGKVEDVEFYGEVDTETPGTYYVFYTYTNGQSRGSAILSVVIL